MEERTQSNSPFARIAPRNGFQIGDDITIDQNLAMAKYADAVTLSPGAWRLEFPLRALQMQLNARETGIKGATILTALLANQDHEF